MRAKPKLCAGCGETKPIWKNHEGNRFCKECWYKQASVEHPTPRKSQIKPKSDKQNVLDRVYSNLRKDFLSQKEHSKCEAKLQNCMRTTGLDLTIHHTKGRGAYYLDTSTWIAVCLSCHEWIETHPAEAKQLLLSQNRNGI